MLNSNLFDKLDPLQVKLQSFKPIKHSLATLASIDYQPLLMKYLATSFDENCKIRGVSFDILKAFDKMWHEELLINFNATRSQETY